MSRYANVIDVIYNKYPCVEQFVDESEVYLLTTKNACELILRSALWKKYLLDSQDKKIKALATKYSQSLSEHGTIIPESTVLLATLNAIAKKNTADLTPEDTSAVVAIADSMKINMQGSRRRMKSSDLSKLILQIVDEIEKKGFRSSAVTMLSADVQIREVFRDFLCLYLQNTCYLSKQDVSIREDFKEAMRIVSAEDIFANMHIGNDYINEIVDDNLAITFPTLYKDSRGKIHEDLGTDLVPDGPVLWENRPVFPRHAMIWVLRKSDYLVTNFISARQGFDTVKNEPDYDVYGQLVCSNRSFRSSGMGKLLLVATILMAYQYKVNYVFIQAFQGVTGVQAPLYNRLGFNFHFDREILKRKTAFYQWSLADPDELNKLHSEYLAGKLDATRMPSKFKHLTYLQPMWLYVRGYETQYACEMLSKPGFDYHSKSPGSMGSGIKKWVWDLPRRLAGYDQATPQETKEVIMTDKSQDRRPDGSKCSQDLECLSDYCIAGSCSAYPYMQKRKSTFIERVDRELVKRGYDPSADEQAREQAKERELELLAQVEKDQEATKAIEKIKQEQDALRSWYELIDLKNREGQASEEEMNAFKKRLEEYNKLTKTGQYAYIAKLLLKGLTDPITKKLFGSK